MRIVLVGVCMLVGLGLVGCAGTRRATDCDPSAADCNPADAAPPIDAPPPIDASPDARLRGFGEACTDGNQCLSDICILAGTGGVCSQLCGECPDGYGCFGVLGAIDPDAVSFVCVATSTQLCSPCQQDQECTLLGMDKCLTEATGRAYCSRDCSTVGCPTGFACANEVIDNVNYRQCVPTSGACDCQTDTQQGAHDPCTITTPLGTSCAGARTCGGTTGWGACQPPSATDVPDAAYADDNCDGIDGDLATGILVSAAGVDDATCGVAFARPCKSISFGIGRAAASGRPNVYVQAAEYDEVMVMRSGVSVWGGYDIGWQRGPHGDPTHLVKVVGKQDTGAGGDGAWLTVRAHDLAAPMTIADLVIQGPDAQGAGGLSGRDGHASYAVHARASQLALVRVQIIAGRGANGGDGATGFDAPSIAAAPAMNGGTGGNGGQGTTTCDSKTRGAGGTPGTNACPAAASSRLTNGGAGGKGGTKDSDCNLTSLTLTATPGLRGADAEFATAPFGIGGPGGSGANACGFASPANGGLPTDGLGGGVNPGGYLSGPGGGYWFARAGGPGQTGENGSGGGGGGGGGGCDNGTDAFGGGGGGGGAGGCAAQSGGGGGGGGGGAFGVVAVASSTISFDACELFRGTAGRAGNGGIGGRGQAGGAAGAGAISHPNTAAPGAGAAGGRGGNAGGGGGGQGGDSIGVVSTASSTINGACTQSQGVAGGGGTGGLSAPSAPPADRGVPGGDGLTGVVTDARVCSATGC